MTLYEAVVARASIRSYKSERLEEETIDKIVDFISELEVPDPSIDWNFDILPYEDMCSLVNGIPRLTAPHYLVLRSEKKMGCLQNAGYFGEMAVLYMTTLGIASCWQGGLECEKDFDNVLPYISAIAFGMSDEPFRTSPEQAKRKRLSVVAAGELSGANRDILEAARLAPTSMGMQPCRFTSIGRRINVYRKKNPIRFPAISYMQCLDVGCALAHIAVAAEEQGLSVKMEQLSPAPEWKKNIYQYTVHLLSRED